MDTSFFPKPIMFFFLFRVFIYDDQILKAYNKKTNRKTEKTYEWDFNAAGKLLNKN